VKPIPAVLFCWSVAVVGASLVADTPRPDAERTPRPLIELLLANDLMNTGSLGGEARLVEYAAGQGPRFGPGRVGMGLDLTASSRGGGSDRSKAGGAALVDAPAVGQLQCFTVSVWFLPIGPNSPARLLYYGPSWDLFVAGNAIGFKTRHDRQDRPHLTPKDRSPVVEGVWNFVAITFDGRTGQACCYHALEDAPPQLICTWSNVPKPDRGTAVLEVGNLGGIRPFRGWIDNVRVFDRALAAEQIKELVARDCPPRPSLPERARSLPPRTPLFDHSDVCLSSRSKRPNSIETIRAFRASRLMWCYSADAEFIQQCKQAGTKTFQSAINSLPGHDNVLAHCLDLEGRPMVAPWMVAFNREKPVYWGCNNRPKFLETSVQRATRALEAGADWIQFDDWALIVSAGAWGGACFCDDCMAAFREYLATHLTEQDRARLELDDLATFDYRRHLAERHGIRDAKAYKTQRRSLPLAPYFEDFQRRSVRKFFTELRRRLDDAAGRRVPLSINSSFFHPAQRDNFIVDLVDFLQGETWHFDLAGLTMACKTAEGLGQWQVFVPKPRDVREMRMGIAAVYAMGQIMLVPWDMYMGSDASGIKPRYYGTVEEYGDLYHFIRDHADLCDGCVNPAVVGVVVDLDHFDRGRVTRLCERLLAAQTPFTFLPVGRSYYPCHLKRERLNTLDMVVVAANRDALPEEDRAVLQSAAGEAVVLADSDLSDTLLRRYSLFEVWGPKHIYVIPRVKPDAATRTLVCHVLNRVPMHQGEERQATHELKWVSFLLKRRAFLGGPPTGARWHMPGAKSIDLELEPLADGTRVILPRLPLWGVVELTFR